MEVNLQIFNDGDQITISEPNSENHIVLRIGPGTGAADALSEYFLDREMVEKIWDWLDTQLDTMKKNEKAQIQTKENG